MVNWKEVCSLVLVGAFWGCTNPLLRKGSSTVDPETSENTHRDENEKQLSLLTRIKESLSKFRQWRVWLPYALNQCGSLIFYWLLASSDLVVAVPVCNALALVFSCVTSYLLGERVDQPIKAIVGSAFVMVGVAICMMSSRDEKVPEVAEVKQEL